MGSEGDGNGRLAYRVSVCLVLLALFTNATNRSYCTTGYEYNLEGIFVAAIARALYYCSYWLKGPEAVTEVLKEIGGVAGGELRNF